MTVALVSLLTGRAVRHDVGMTGEVTLRGRVLPIGGLKQKVLAAHRAGLTDVILPARNAGDLDDVPETVREVMRFHPVHTVEEALAVALEAAPSRRCELRSGHCGIGPVCGRYHAAADLICKRWSVSVVAVLVEHEPVRFNQLREAVPGITPKLLSERLRELEAAGVVERRVTASVPVLVEYRMTPKGLALRELVGALQTWADAWS